MSKWQGKSDAEINAAVKNILVSKHGKESDFDRFFLGILKSSDLDYCNNAAFAWPIIVGNLISLSDPITVGYCGNWLASKTAQGEHFDCLDKNPLRAAMIVYLEMNEINSK